MIKHINTGIAELIAVKVPDDAQNIRIAHGDILVYESYIDSIWMGDVIQLPPAFYELLGTAHELTEEVWASVLPIITGWSKPLYHNHTTACSDYRDIIESAFKTATESGLSLLAANEIYAVNPYEDKEELDDGNFFGLVDAVIHKQAQGNTGKWVLLKKIEG